MKIGERIRKAREAEGIGAQDLASRAGLHLNTLYKIELGKQNPTVETLEKIAAALGRDLRVTLAERRAAA